MRHNYVSQGPNFVWHVDGYDKLKPFGFCIHGSIDSFSRKIIWLEVGVTNNHSRTIAKYYLECVKQQSCLPRILRYERGTENSPLKIIQPSFRNECEDAFAVINSIIFGKITSNHLFRPGVVSLEDKELIGG